jgi:hypothetical protein
VFNILKFHGDNLKMLQNKNIFLNLQKSITNSSKALSSLVEQNIFNIKYITESDFGGENDEMEVDDTHEGN